MSPVSTFHNSGSSSRLSLRNQYPNRVVRCQLGSGRPSWSLSEVIVRNFGDRRTADRRARGASGGTGWAGPSSRVWRRRPQRAQEPWRSAHMPQGRNRVVAPRVATPVGTLPRHQQAAAVRWAVPPERISPVLLRLEEGLDRQTRCRPVTVMLRGSSRRLRPAEAPMAGGAASQGVEQIESRDTLPHWRS